jgi:WD40 repeat protein
MATATATDERSVAVELHTGRTQAGSPGPTTRTFSTSLPDRLTAQDNLFQPDKVLLSRHFIGVTGGVLFNSSHNKAPAGYRMSSNVHGVVALWNRDTGDLVIRDWCETDTDHGLPPIVSIAADEQRLVLGLGLKLCRWNLPSRARLNDVVLNDLPSTQKDIPDSGALSYLASSKAFLAANIRNEKSTQSYIVDESGAQISSFTGMSRLSPDGKTLAKADAERVRLSSPIVKGPTLTLTLNSEVQTLEWSPDSKLLSTSEADGTLKVFRASDGVELNHIDLEKEMGSFAWSPDSSRIAVWGAGIVRVFDARNGLDVLPPIRDSRAAIDGYSEGDLLWPAANILVLDRGFTVKLVDLTTQMEWKPRICSGAQPMSYSRWNDEISDVIPYRDPCA